MALLDEWWPHIGLNGIADVLWLLAQLSGINTCVDLISTPRAGEPMARLVPLPYGEWLTHNFLGEWSTATFLAPKSTHYVPVSNIIAALHSSWLRPSAQDGASAIHSVAWWYTSQYSACDLDDVTGVSCARAYYRMTALTAPRQHSHPSSLFFHVAQ